MLRNAWTEWQSRTLRRRANRALSRQLEYQNVKARKVRGREADVIAAMSLASQRVRSLLEEVKSIKPDARVLEVCSGAHGLIFSFGARSGVGLDPLAVHYASLFPNWQRSAATVAAVGESLPFADGSFDIVLSDNVVDHAERPATILAEMARVLAPAGLVYFTVNVHHPFYAIASTLHDWWNMIGISYEITPFADHTVHLTLGGARGLFKGLPLSVLREHVYMREAKEMARRSPPHHPGDRIKRIFFKNALFEVVAVRKQD
jgi:ubiquinone/menaquinone biosynthesis C-methylase UbiE